MRFLYSLVYTCGFLIVLPYFLIVGLFRRKYFPTLGQRFGNIKQSSDAPSIWVHAVSVGEFLACKALIQKLKSVAPNRPVFISTTTITAQKLAEKSFPGFTFYFPFDWAWTVRKVLRKIRPGLIAVMETEIWPNFLWETQSAGIPTLLINGRLSDRSMRRYSIVKRWLPMFDQCWMQSESDAEKMRSLGAVDVFTCGNLKYDVKPAQISQNLQKIIAEWKGQHLLWIAGSTMPAEEGLVLDVFRSLKREYPLKLLLAPRHPERFAEVKELIAAAQFQSANRTTFQPDDAASDVMLLDTIGELAGAYEDADVVLIGGTLTENGGGHNPIEPAYFGKAIVSGIYFNNFRAVFHDFQRHNAIFITDDLLIGMQQLLISAEKRSALGNAARILVEQNAGATEKVFNAVLQQFEAANRTPGTALLS